ncbi:hypothetical protein [Streptomyces chryseus]|uniref:hypothetical protein n=1 Tax=Streptomyces chryseus TaxID=68186 RepID=UPI0019A75F06|nr:hypothetical protein [Streptomyces chryseus]GGX11333.1 hypothetical protein GCM10010353_28270 [Streptomyces chryseus]
MSGPARTGAGVRRGTPPPVPGPWPRWAADPLDELAARLGESAAAAVHPDEIAAILESDGMTDDHIRLTYGRENSFALAEDLFARVPRAYPEPEPPRTAVSPWDMGLTGCLLRGLVFALPGLAYVLGAPFLASPPGDGSGLPAGTDVLLVGTLVGWAWNQALAHRAYAWLGAGDRRSASRALLTGAPAGALLGTVAALAVAGPGDGGATAFATAQALYQGAATALLVLGRERALLSALTPMTAGALLTLVYDVPSPARAALLAVSGAAVVVLAGREVLRARGAAVASGARGPGRRTGAGKGRAGKGAAAPGGAGAGAPRGPSLLRSVPYGVFGLATGTLVLHAVLRNTLAGEAASGVVAAPGAVALTLSMGPAEWLLYRFRRGCDAGLRRSTTPRAFRRAATLVLGRCLGAYVALLFALLAATTLLWIGAPVPDPARATGLLLIGVTLWTGLLLQAFGAVTTAATVCGTAALLRTAALFADPPVPAVAAFAVPVVAAAVLTALVCVLLGRATAHRR